MKELGPSGNSEILTKLEEIQHLYNMHDDSVSDFIKILLQKGDVFLYSFAMYLSNGYNVNEYYEHLSFVINNLSQQELQKLEIYILEVTKSLSQRNNLNLDGIECFMKLDIKKANQWKELLEEEKIIAANTRNKLLGTNVDFSEFISFVSLSIMAIEQYLASKYTVNSSNFNEWARQSEGYKELLEKAYNALVLRINRILELL
ncbi:MULTISPECIES: hypothetical protein [Paenibacillus]|uniref:hypothetical protein n=1 Tax=Paenibacillus TaxID=44249 RepID=UPI0022B86518|nr:hypothetical protein [Paenibacillus caseinilyticus]MCZ8518426.1 hypothetical protein [Paenibacillus caseinilyticus]